MANITGTGGNDTLSGTSADDVLDGLAGVDTAFFLETGDHYRLGRSGLFLTLDQRVITAIDDGVDSLRSIEKLHFSDRTFTVVQEFRLTAAAGTGQGLPASAGLEAGEYVVLWQATSAGDGAADIFAQRYAADGTLQGTQFSVNLPSSGEQFDPAVAALAGGGFVATWTSGGQDGDRGGVYARLFDALGSAVGSDILVNETTVGEQRDSSVAQLSSGGYVVCWSSQGEDGSGEGVYLRAYGSAGLAASGAVLANTRTSGDQLSPDVTALAGGGFLVTWASYSQDGSGYGVYAQRFDDTAGAQGGEFRVNTRLSLSQYDPAVAGLATGGAVVVWVSQNQDGSRTGIYAQLLDDSGVPVGSEFRVNAYTLYEQQSPDVVALAGGGFVVTWESRGQDGSGFGVYSRSYSSAGVALSGDMQVNGNATGQQFAATVTALADGGYAAGWISQGLSDYDTGLFGASFDASANTRGPMIIRGTSGADYFNLSGSGALQAQGLAGDDTYAVNELGDMVVESPLSGTDTIVSSISMVLPENVETLRLSGLLGLSGTGNTGANTIFGNAGANVLDGAGGSDSLRGAAGNDTYTVHLGDLVIEGSSAGSDTVVSDISWTLASNVENLLLTGIDSVMGTGNVFANNMTGNDAGNILKGLGGNDTLNGMAGDDTLDGGSGADLLTGADGDDWYLVGAGDTVREDSADGGADTVFSSTDWTLGPNIENLSMNTGAKVGVGNELGNTIVASQDDNFISGLSGDDTLDSGLGRSTLNGGDGNDVIYTHISDTLVFDTPLSELDNLDLIVDFGAVGLRIWLDDDVFTGFDASVRTSLSPAQILEAPGATAALTAAQRIIYDTDAGRLYYDADGVGGLDAVQFAQIGTTTHRDLLVGNFVIIG